jgi:decaprenyl-phosphate phosphoribosyltransferase
MRLKQARATAGLLRLATPPPAHSRPLIALVSLTRPTHWIKNLFVLAPLAFAAGAWGPETVAAGGLAFLCFCLLSSAVYCLNDVHDAARDRAHPLKRHRPVASGRIRAGVAVTFGCGLAVAALLIAGRTLPGAFAAIGLLYLANNVLYGLLLKEKVIADVMSIAFGFVLRLLAGAIAIGVTPSSWLVVCGFSLALLLGFGKRRTELTALGDGSAYRPSLQIYTPENVNTLVAICASLALLTYMLYTVSPDTIRVHHTSNLVYSVPFVAYGIFRFIFKVQEGRATGPVEILLSDYIFQLNALLWVAAVLIIRAVSS